MSPKDLLQRFIFEKAPIRGQFVHLQESYQTIVNQHPYPEPLKRLLGEALCVASLLSGIIKFKGRLTVQFRGEGKLKLLLAQCNNEFELRGLAKWEGENITYEELIQSFHEGVLVIMLDSGVNTSRYQGVVSWQGNSLAQAIEGYFKDSEQLATKIWLAVNDTSAAGFLLQVLPGSDNDNTATEEQIINPQWQHVAELTSNLYTDDMLNVDYQSLLNKLYPNEEIRVFPSTPIKFNCSCSRKRGEDAIMLLGKDEIDEELKSKQVIVVTCDFCNKEYVFDKIDVAKLFEAKDRPMDTHLH